MDEMRRALPWYMDWIYRIREYEWEKYKSRRASRLERRDCTIISSSCNGTVMYHDLGLPYLSPTINLCIDAEDFIKMAEHLEWYMNGQIIEAKEELPYPVGMLYDVRIQFIHYRSFQEAAAKWEERKRRINWDHIFIVGVSSDGDREMMERFERLPYENKVIFSPIECPECKSVFCIKEFKRNWGVMTEFKNRILKRRYLDNFDYVTFLNRGKQARL